MGLAKKLRNVTLSSDNEIIDDDSDFSLDSIKKFKRHERYQQNVQREQYRQISLNCLNDKALENTNEKVSSGLWYKLLLVILTSLISYYGIYQVVIIYFKTQLDTTYFNLVIFLLLILFSFIFMYCIWMKDFGKTQFFVYTILYTLFTGLGCLTIIMQVIPITSYQILNLFFFILVFQIIMFYFSTPITRRLVCRIDQKSYRVRNIDFEN